MVVVSYHCQTEEGRKEGRKEGGRRHRLKQLRWRGHYTPLFFGPLAWEEGEGEEALQGKINFDKLDGTHSDSTWENEASSASNRTLLPVQQVDSSKVVLIPYHQINTFLDRRSCDSCKEPNHANNKCRQLAITVLIAYS